jgi:sortase B
MATLTAVLLLVAFAGYALWDSDQIHREADATRHAIWKPTVDEGESFSQLRSINPDVFAWLTVYGTNIDYPVAQGSDNLKYVNTSAEGEYSLSGSIFLDYENDPHFGDFNSVLYGHHMEKNAMFGDIGTFADQATFDTHRFGNLFFDDADHGIEFFAFIHTDAYDQDVFTAAVGDTQRQSVLDSLIAKATHVRDVGVDASDRLVLLTTCSSSSTNGRDILVAVLTDQSFVDAFARPEAEFSRDGAGVDARVDLLASAGPWIVVALLVGVAAVVVVVLKQRARTRGRRGLERGLV